MVGALNSSQHPLQLLDPLQDLRLDRPQFGQDLQRWTVLYLFVNQGHDGVVPKSVTPAPPVNLLLQAPSCHQKVGMIILICILFPGHGALQSPC